MKFRVASQPSGSQGWDDVRWLQWLDDDGRLLSTADVGAHRCRLCHGPLASSHPRCYPCHADVRPHLAGLFPITYSTKAGLEPLIWGVKDNDQRWLERPLGALLNAVLERHWDHLIAAFGPVDMMIPVPSHPTVRDGYDHVRAILAPYRNASWAEARINTGALVRTRPTRTGRTVDPTLFAVRPEVSLIGLRIALLDDTFTKGATLASAAAALRNAGATSVIGVTLGRQLNLDYEFTPPLYEKQRGRAFDLGVCVLDRPAAP